MNTQRLAQRAYTSAIAPTRTSRGVEYEAFARVTHRLAKAARSEGRSFSALADALHENRRLWTTLAAAVADGDNGLPLMMRAQIFWLAEFTETHSRKVLRQEAAVAPLVEVNAAIMRGLRMEGPEK